MSTITRLILFASFLAAFFVSPVHGTTWIIQPDGSGDAATIQAGVDSAAAGDTVMLADGTFTGDGNRDIDFGGKNLVLMSENGAESTVIDSQGSSSDTHRALIFQTGETASSSVIGLTIRGGFPQYTSDFFGPGGGGAMCINASPSFLNCVFENNTASYGGGGAGGGIACKNASPQITGCTFRSNVGWRGGGVYCDGGSPVILDCDFDENTSAEGGGLHCRNGSTPFVALCTFYANGGSPGYSANAGAGLYCVSSSPTVSNCTFDQNGTVTTVTAGGAIYCGSSSLDVDSCVFTGNVSWGPGGAIHCTGGSLTPSITGSTFTGNWARTSSYWYGGGAIACDYMINGNALISGNTIEGNTAGQPDGSEGHGGGILCHDADALIDNNTIRQNQALGRSLAAGGGIYLDNSDATITSNTVTENSVEADHLSPESTAKGGAIYLLDSNPSIGGSPGTGNTFENNTALVGSDLAKTGGAAVVDAQYNTFEIYPVSGYYVSPFGEFDVSNGTGLTPAITTDVIVSPSGAASRSSSGAQETFTTIQAALRRVAPSPTDPITIHVAPGTYSPSTTGETFPLAIFEHIAVVGAGFDQSILDAEDTHRVFHCENVGEALIKGLMIRGGKAGSGGGIVCRSSSVRIECNTVAFNQASWGAGIACFDSPAPEIVGNIITDNVFLYTPYFAILGGGVLAFRDCSPYLGNNLIARNTSGYGGGLLCNDHSNAMVFNNTICDNDAQDSGGGIALWNTSNATIQNTLVWNNTAGADPAIQSCCGSAPDITYSDIEGGWSDPGGTNLDIDPQFDFTGRYYLLPSSPVIDAGNPDPSFNDVENPDLPGTALFPAMGALRNDMGVYGGPEGKDLYESGTVAVTISGFFAEYRHGIVHLEWVITEADGLKGFKIYRSAGGDDGFYALTPGLVGDARTREYVDTDVRPGTTYNYRLGAVDHDGEYLSTIVSVKIAPRDLALYQNQPNPFNPSTTISFYLPETADTKVVVYDATGRRIRTLVDEVQSFGVHEVEWDGRADNGNPVSSGVYFYRLSSGRRTFTKKMVLLK